MGLVLAAMLVQAPGALALDCFSISQVNRVVCQSILDSNITLEEKEALISNLEYSSKYYPDHNYIFLRNTVLNINTAPYGVQLHQGQFVKDAWMSIFAVMPSVLYNNTLLVSSQAKLLTGFNYRIDIPQDYTSSGYPNTNQGDCKRTYILTSNNSENKVFANSNNQGSGRLVDLILNSDSRITAQYNVSVDVLVEHYSWNRYCCRWYSDNTCRRYCTSCDYSHQEVRPDRISINDSLNVKFYNNTLIGSLKVLDQYDQTTKIDPNFSNSIEIKFNDSLFSFYEYEIEINYSKPPYYIATLKARDYKKEQTNNLFKENDNLIVKNTKGCRIRSFDLFNTQESNCDLEYYDYGFYITTNKLWYASGTIINVSVIPRNITVNLTYGSQSKLISGNTSFTAELYANKLRATYKDKSSEHNVFVYDKSKLSLLYKLLAFLLFVYIFYKLGKKFFRRVR